MELFLRVKCSACDQLELFSMVTVPSTWTCGTCGHGNTVPSVEAIEAEAALRITDLYQRRVKSAVKRRKLKGRVR